MSSFNYTLCFLSALVNLLSLLYSFPAPVKKRLPHLSSLVTSGLTLSLTTYTLVGSALMASWTFLWISTMFSVLLSSRHLDQFLNIFSYYSSPLPSQTPSVHSWTWLPMILCLWISALYLTKHLFLDLFEPGKRLVWWGIWSPPSQAPLRAPKTLAPVVVLYNPTSRTALNGLYSPWCLLTSYLFPTSSLPLYIVSIPRDLSSLLARRSPVEYAAG